MEVAVDIRILIIIVGEREKPRCRNRIKYPGAEDIIVRMDSFDSSRKMCALALFENNNDVTFSVQKIVQFFSGHQEMDTAFGWGLKWVAGRK